MLKVWWSSDFIWTCYGYMKKVLLLWHADKQTQLNFIIDTRGIWYNARGIGDNSNDILDKVRSIWYDTEGIWDSTLRVYDVIRDLCAKYQVSSMFQEHPFLKAVLEGYWWFLDRYFEDNVIFIREGLKKPKLFPWNFPQGGVRPFSTTFCR